MHRFAIRDTERLTGIRAHTIRAWERRFGLFQPERANSNIRMYSFGDLECMVHLQVLIEDGYRISELAVCSRQQLSQLIPTLKSITARQCMAVYGLLLPLVAEDLQLFRREFARTVTRWPDEVLVHRILYPLLHKMNLLTTGKGLASEHLAVSMVRQKMLQLIDGDGDLATPEVTAGQPAPALLFLPGSQQLDLLLLLAQYEWQRRGLTVISLGRDVDFTNIVKAIRQLNPGIVATYLPAKSRFPLDDLQQLLRSDYPHCRLYLLGDRGLTNASRQTRLLPTILQFPFLLPQPITTSQRG